MIEPFATFFLLFKPVRAVDRRSAADQGSDLRPRAVSKFSISIKKSLAEETCFVETFEIYVYEFLKEIRIDLSNDPDLSLSTGKSKSGRSRSRRSRSGRSRSKSCGEGDMNLQRWSGIRIALLHVMI